MCLVKTILISNVQIKKTFFQQCVSIKKSQNDGDQII